MYNFVGLVMFVIVMSIIFFVDFVFYFIWECFVFDDCVLKGGML